jgi:uncharacterized protein
MASPKRKRSGTGKCPICGRATDAQYRPFCSRRCADVDLSRWLSGAYAVPGREDADEDGERADPVDAKKNGSGEAH